MAIGEPVTIAALGDSLTAGYGLPAGAGLVPQLQAWLGTRGHDVVLLNAGVSGDTTAGGRARLDWTLTPDVDALIVELGGNDLLRGIDPAASRANLDAILQGATARGLPVLLVGLSAPRNYGPEFKTEFDTMYPELAAHYGALLFANFFQPLITGRTQADLEADLQADGIHPNAGGVIKIVQGLGPAVEALLERVATP